jgi:uncharacterized coiled-coil protein SlyX
MTTLEARLSDLRTAAQTFNDSGQRIQQSVQITSEVLDGLMALGYESPAAAELLARYHAQRRLMDEWGNKLRAFAVTLTSAADELANATQSAPPATATPTTALDATTITAAAPMMSAVVRDYRPRYRYNDFSSTAAAPPAVAAQASAAMPEPTLTEYLSAANQPLAAQLHGDQNALNDASLRLNQLLRDRQAAVGELTTLQTRLQAFGDAGAANPPRLAALQTQIAALDTQITATHNEIDSLQTRIQHAIARLERVKPAAGANLVLIAGMEGGQTADIIRQNTYTCVNHIVNRMPIPVEIARDAYLWDDQARLHPEYGIRIGNTPLEGAVIVMEREHSYADPLFGHVLYVERVDADGVWVTDNRHSDPVLLSALTSETSGPHLRYLYFPWQTRA